MSSATPEKDLEVGDSPLPDDLQRSRGDRGSGKHLYLWIAANVVAVAAITHINKAILSNSSFSNCDLSFIAFHFALSSLVLYIAKQLFLEMSTPVEISVTSVVPLSVVMCLNVILVNRSLSSCSVIFYQICRALLTPLTALINLILYHSKLPLNAVLSFIPLCAGVGLVTYPDVTLPPPASPAEEPVAADPNPYLGVMYAFSGVACSSLYTVWVANYHSRLNVSSMQLLYTQLPLSAGCIGVLSLFVDHFPTWSRVTIHQWCLLLLSGLCACIINLSSFVIIHRAGPVTSTVIGQLKTCLIVALSWARSPGTMGKDNVIGVLLTLSGMILYTVAVHKKRVD